MEENILDRIKLGKWQRFANSIIDTIFFWIFILGLGAILGVFLALTNPTMINLDQDFNVIFEYILTYGLLILFYGLQESFLKGRTIGKLVTGSITVDKKGETINFKKAFHRSICRLIPFDAFSFLGDSERGWHDTITETYVVNKKKWEELKNNTVNQIDQIGTSEKN